MKEIFEILMETNLRIACAEKGKCGFQNSNQRRFFGEGNSRFYENSNVRALLRAL